MAPGASDARASMPGTTCALVDSQNGIRTAIAAFEARLSAILTADQLTKFQALIQAGDSTDAFPGCPPAST